MKKFNVNLKKKMLVGLKDYFPINLEGESDGVRENGNLELLELIKKGKEKNVFFEIYKKNMHKKDQSVYTLFFSYIDLYLYKIFYINLQAPEASLPKIENYMT